MGTPLTHDIHFVTHPALSRQALFIALFVATSSRVGVAGQMDGVGAVGREQVGQMLVACEKQDLLPLGGQIHQQFDCGSGALCVEIDDHVVEYHRQRDSLP